MIAEENNIVASNNSNTTLPLMESEPSPKASFGASYYEKNKERIKQYYLNNRERILNYQKEYREKHKDELDEKRKQNKEAINEKVKEYSKQKRLELAKYKYIEQHGNLDGFEGVKRGRPRKY